MIFCFMETKFPMKQKRSAGCALRARGRCRLCDRARRENLASEILCYCVVKKMNNVNTKDEYTLAAKCQGIFMCEIRTVDSGGSVYTNTLLE